MAGGGGKHTLLNASISGETTQGALARLPALLKEHKPDWLLIELGGNDGLRGFAPTITRQNLASMIALAKEQQTRVVLTQIQLPRNYGARYLRQFEQIFPSWPRLTICRYSPSLWMILRCALNL